MRLCQRLCALLAVLAIAANLTAGANTWAMSGDMDSPAGMADMSSPDCDGDDCSDHEMTGAACYAACGGALAVLSTSMGTNLWSGQDLYPLPMPTQIGQTSPPGPSPPRSFILS